MTSNYIQLVKNFPNDVHSEIASLVFAALSRPLHYENGDTSMEFDTVERIWHDLCSLICNEADARLYEPAMKLMHSLACDENETKCFL